MSERPVLTYSEGPGKPEEKVSTADVIFILITDIGVKSILKVLLNNPNRTEIPHTTMRRVVKNALDLTWKRLNFGKVINEVVPFLPFEPKQIEEVVELKLQQLSQQHARTKWAELCTTSELRRYLSSPASRFITYDSHSLRASSTGLKKLYSKYGARNVDNGGPLQFLKAKLFRYLQPWQTDKVVHVRFDEKERKVSILRCATPDSDTEPGASDDEQAGSDGDGEARAGKGGTCTAVDEEGACAESLCAVSWAVAEEEGGDQKRAGCELVWEGALR